MATLCVSPKMDPAQGAPWADQGSEIPIMTSSGNAPYGNTANHQAPNAYYMVPASDVTFDNQVVVEGSTIDYGVGERVGGYASNPGNPGGTWGKSQKGIGHPIYAMSMVTTLAVPDLHPVVKKRGGKKHAQRNVRGGFYDNSYTNGNNSVRGSSSNKQSASRSGYATHTPTTYPGYHNNNNNNHHTSPYNAFPGYAQGPYGNTFHHHHHHPANPPLAFEHPDNFAFLRASYREHTRSTTPIPNTHTTTFHTGLASTPPYAPTTGGPYATIGNPYAPFDREYHHRTPLNPKATEFHPSTSITTTHSDADNTSQMNPRIPPQTTPHDLARLAAPETGDSDVPGRERSVSVPLAGLGSRTASSPPSSSSSSPDDDSATDSADSAGSAVAAARTTTTTITPQHRHSLSASLLPTLPQPQGRRRQGPRSHLAMSSWAGILTDNHVREA
ncbi:hypothetical protein EJ05DRAFT_495545 [Pseudovirgaria hyperparasitica]|uniref:Uncharacterized protein n=1 Tax=Pseudovirgaria hyperparasitica TaxID=470096 RepID=A0A6A6WKI7_9PEZI|nr:uncharacterized protein EJ05DRAFT_495545 [Pseudovirgaria hyperparasitica]KAF2762676.1 hypothetical protein EJ05DRAFT_495545 [Pseudovirgaria hyperparasitica]